MLPTRVNLLSPQKQGYLHRMVYMQFFKHLLQTILALLCIIAGMLMVTEILLADYIQAIQQKVSIAPTRITQVNNDVTFINKTIQRTAAIQEEFIPWTTHMSDLLVMLPTGIFLNDMQFNGKTKQIILTGTTDTRDTLISFINTLELSPNIISADVPISQLTQKESSSFSLTILLK